MGVISFYRGNLHKVPDTPRRWPIPKPSISLQDFKILLEKRNKALLRVEYNNNSDTNNAEQPQAIEEENHEAAEEGMGDNGCTKQEDKCSLGAARNGDENKYKRDEDLEDSDRRDAKYPRLDAGIEKEKEIEKNGPVPMDCEQISSKDFKGPLDLAQVSDSAKLKKRSFEEMDVDSKKHDPAEGEKVPTPDQLAVQESSQQMKASLTAACHSQHNTSSSSPIPSSLLIGAHGSHTQHVHIPPVSASAAQIGVSSPSPATSSGTSIFRDTRRASPWNQR